MRTLIFTSALTFVPDNYDDLVVGLLSHPHVAGLVVEDNRDNLFLAQASALWLSGAAPRFGAQLWRNRFSSSLASRREICASQKKLFWMDKDLNSEEVCQLIRSERIDLVLNARTRTFFKKALLASPRLGCVNIHHGLLPRQRGLMCDFWSFLDNEPSGFSVHVMTPKLDDGRILRAVEVPKVTDDYLQTLQKTAKRELEVCSELLHQIASGNSLPEGEPNRHDQIRYRSNPRLADFYRLRRKGVRL